MSSSKKYVHICRDFAAGVYLFEAQNPVHPPPFHTVDVYTVYLFNREGGKGGELNQKEGESTDYKAGLKITK
jgi:hypothetical protein